MCDICQKLFCPSACPDYLPKDEPRCSDCGSPVFYGDCLSMPNGKNYCNDCISEMDITEVLQICGVSTTRELLLTVLSADDAVSIKK